MHLAGCAPKAIVDEVEKEDGAPPSQQAVTGAIRQAEMHGGMSWDGEAAPMTGRPPATSVALDKQILRLVFKHRGRAVVTTKFVKKKIPSARKVSARTLSRRLCAAGLAWLRRRRKSLVPTEYKMARLQWAAWVAGCTAQTLARWAYTDGASFYLARTEAEHESKVRAALGLFVWRMANGSDACTRTSSDLPRIGRRRALSCGSGGC